jgi:TonB family protein
MRAAALCIALLAACASSTAPPEHGGSASVSPSPSAAPPAASFVEPPPAVATASPSARVDEAPLPKSRQRPKRDCGRLVASSFEHWRGAIESYVSSVLPGNQRALNTAAVPFATYLNGMHNRIHPLFADCFLESLDELPPTHPLNDQHLITRLEIVLSSDGHVRRMGIVRTSGITAFDIAVLDAFERAQPFGPAPNDILSADGNVYVHWEVHRDEVFACSTMGARPFLLVNAP